MYSPLRGEFLSHYT